MKTTRQKSIVVLALMFVLSLCLSFVVAPAPVSGETPTTFEMVSGAQVALHKDGIRYVAKMDAGTYETIVKNDTAENVSLEIYVAPKTIFDAVTDGAYVNLAKKVTFEIPDANIYKVGDFYYANALLTNLDTATATSQIGYEFVGIAAIKDMTSGEAQYTYASFAGGDIANNVATQYDLLQDAFFDSSENANAVLALEAYNWFGTEEYPIVIDTAEKTQAFEQFQGEVDFSEVKVNDTYSENAGLSQIPELRIGDDVNTLFFFSRVQGKFQLTTAGNTNISGVPEYDAEKKATKVSMNTIDSETKRAIIGYKIAGYEFAEGDYVAFDIYLDVQEGTDSSLVFRMSGGENAYGTCVYNQEYAQVLVPATQFVDNGTFFLYANTNADVYLYDAKVLSADQVKDIATTGSETTYMVSHYDFVGGAYATTAGTLGTASFEATYSPVGGQKVGACAWSPNGATYSQASDVVPYYVNGAIRFYVRAHEKNGMASTQRLVLKLANRTSFSNGAIVVVARGADFSGVVYLRDSAGDYSGQKTMKVADDQSGVADGYVKYTMTDTFNSSWASEKYDYIIFTVKSTSGADYSQAMISSMWFPNIINTCQYEEVVAEEFLAAEATCEAPATYYKSCRCGKVSEETFTVGEASHDFSQEIMSEDTLATPADCLNAATYYKSCSKCGAVSETETFTYGEVGGHNFVGGVCTVCEENQFDSLRTGDDANTLFFFNQADGRDQLAIAGGSNLSDIVYDEVKGAVKVTINTTGSSSSWASVPYKTMGYQFQEGDYVAFDIYLEVKQDSNAEITSATAVSFAFLTATPRNATIVYHGQYAQVLVPATVIEESTDSKFWIEASKKEADIYLFKAKVLTADQVKDIATTGSETTYKLGAYDFVGGNYATHTDIASTLGTINFEASYTAIQGASVGACAWSTNGAVYSQVSDVVPYYVNGAIRFYVRDHQKNGMGSTQKVVLKTAKGYNFSSGVISVVARGVAVTNVTLKGSTNASYGGSRTMSKDADQSGVPAGYVRYTMDSGFNTSWSSETLDYFIFTVSSLAGSYAQGSIIDIKLP